MPARSSGITWGEATFKEYIRIQGQIPGTKMIFAGIKTGG